MNVGEALQVLGANRVIWIDDHFNKGDQLAKLLLNNIEAAKNSTDESLVDILGRYEYSSDPHELEQYIKDAAPEVLAKLKDEFFAQEAEAQQMATRDLSESDVGKACHLLGVKDTDRWTFKDAYQHLAAVCNAGDESVSYVVDLNETGGSDKEGLQVLRRLGALKSLGTAFILTHEASVATEQKVEDELRGALAGPAGGAKEFDIPVCVIAKQRISDAESEVGIEDALRVAIKRAGLRRSMHEVLGRASKDIQEAFHRAAEMLVSIPPEQLDKFVVERGYNEGVSELHVVERALSAKMADCLRTLFATDETVQKSAARLRALRKVELKADGAHPHEHLDGFRKLEVWESDDLLNGSYTPIACGDVFESDALEVPSNAAVRRFVLLGQPCDIGVRPSGKRQQEIAYFVPLKKKSSSSASKEAKLKEAALQFSLDGSQWVCDFREAGPVQLRILDLASLRQDGRVRVDKDQGVPSGLLVGLEVIAAGRQANAKSLVDSTRAAGAVESYETQLAFRSDNTFKAIHQAKLCDPKTVNQGGSNVQLPRRVTWGLRRVGRIRMPYASALLRDYLAMSGREAFDLDYTKREDENQTEVQVASTACVC